MDFLSGQRIIYASERFDKIYQLFKEDYGVSIHQLFLIAMTVGFTRGKKVIRETKGREFRSNYFSAQEKAKIYVMLLNDETINRSIEEFNKEDFPNKAQKLMENYAEGGMEILIEEVFGDLWNGFKLDETYNEYDIDILSFISLESKKAPF